LLDRFACIKRANLYQAHDDGRESGLGERGGGHHHGDFLFSTNAVTLDAFSGFAQAVVMWHTGFLFVLREAVHA